MSRRTGRWSGHDSAGLARATHARQPVSGSLLDLQRSAGNIAVQGLLDSANPNIAHVLEPVPRAVEAVVAEPGRLLEPEVRAELEPVVGGELSTVRVHDDSKAAASAEAIQARAYTSGEHVVFGPDRYAPQTASGRRLIAHELGHVVAGRRQGAGRGAVMRDPKDGAGLADRTRLMPTVAPPQVAQLGTSTIATIYFARDTFLMEAASFAAVDKLAARLSFMAKPLVAVDGYASTEGPEKRNVELARLRRDSVLSVLTSKASGIAAAGEGHGASQPAVPETAIGAPELEQQRALNRRVTIVITDLSATADAQPTPPAPKPKSPINIFGPIPQEPETPKQEQDRHFKEMMKLPADLSLPKKSFSEQFWTAVDDKLDSQMATFGVPKKYRGMVKDGAHAAIEKGADATFDAVLDAAQISGQAKEAIKAAVKAAAQTKY